MTMELRISTHNSATGEPSATWLDRLMTPVARCQAKTLAGQYDAGCRYFDLRAARDRSGRWACAHGHWRSRTSLAAALRLLDGLARQCAGPLYVSVTLERGVHGELEALRRHAAEAVAFPAFTLTYWATKEGGWHIEATDRQVPLRHEFYDLGRRWPWRLLLPFPRLWAWVWTKARGRHAFTGEAFTQVDFL